MAILQENNAKLTVAVQVNEETIKVMKEHDTQQAAQINELQEGLNRATQDRKDLEAKFRNKDISAMGRKDAKLLEDKINRATQRAFDDLEKTTGLTDVPMPSANTGAKNAQ